MDPEPDQYGYGSLGKQWKPCFSFYVLSCKILHRVEGRNELSYTKSLEQFTVWRQHSASSMYVGLVQPVRTRYRTCGRTCGVSLKTSCCRVMPGPQVTCGAVVKRSRAFFFQMGTGTMQTTSVKT